METNPPRNSRSQTHQNDGTRGEADYGLAPALRFEANRIDRSAYALKTHNESFGLRRCPGRQPAPLAATPLMAVWPGPLRQNGPSARRH